MNTLIKHTVTIFGDSFTIVTDEPIDSLDQAVTRVNEMAKVIVEQTGTIDTKKLAVLTVLQAVMQIQQMEQRQRNLTALVDRHLVHL